MGGELFQVVSLHFQLSVNMYIRCFENVSTPYCKDVARKPNIKTCILFIYIKMQSIIAEFFEEFSL